MPTWLGGWGWWMSHHISRTLVWAPFRGPMASARRHVLGLSGRSTAADGQPIIYGFSRHVLEVPNVGPRRRYTTGYWQMPTPADWTPPKDLEAFLAKGGPVVSIGFGSMASGDPKALTAMVIEAIRRAQVRAVLLSGWGGLNPTDGDGDVYFARELPHPWLFPRVAAVVHHGGAGTTGASVAAGVPALLVPFTLDQPFWAWRLRQLGISPSPIPRKQLTADKLADGLVCAVSDAKMRAAAADIGERVRSEDGVANAVEVFEKLPASLKLASLRRNGKRARTGPTNRAAG
jgi:sterol 3beta-glucosyltransferase